MIRRLQVVAVALASLLVLVSGCSRSGSRGGSALGPQNKSAYEFGMDRLREGNYVGASYQFQKAVREDPASIPAYLQLASAYTEAGLEVDHDFFEKAQAVFDTLKTRIPEDDLRLVKGEARLKLAMWQVDDAINMYEEALAQNPEDCEFWTLLGEAIRAKGIELRETVGENAEADKLSEAVVAYKKAVELCPDDFDAYQGIAIVYAQRKRYRDIVTMYIDLRKQYPDSLRVLRDYTHARFQARDWAEAADGFAQLMDVDPTPDERLMYYTVLRKLNRIEESDRQKAIYMETAPQKYGPEERTPEDVLREQLGINEIAKKAGSLMDEKKYDEARALWNEALTRTRAKVDDPEYGDAARSILIWLERRLDYINAQEGIAKP